MSFLLNILLYNVTCCVLVCMACAMLRGSFAISLLFFSDEHAVKYCIQPQHASPTMHAWRVGLHSNSVHVAQTFLSQSNSTCRIMWAWRCQTNTPPPSPHLPSQNNQHKLIKETPLQKPRHPHTQIKARWIDMPYCP